VKINTKLTSEFKGIIQLLPEESEKLIEIQDKILKIFPDQKRILKKGSPSFHITLLHQSIPKSVGQGKLRGDKLLKSFFKTGNQMELDNQSMQLELGDTFISSQEGRISTFIKIVSRETCMQIRDKVLIGAGLDLKPCTLGDKESTRVFHISLTNLTGNSGDSITFPQDSDKRILA